MSEAKKPTDKQQSKQPPKQPVVLSSSIPPQTSPKDTSNWDDRAFTTPTNRIVIETNQTNDGIVIAE